MSFRTWRNVVRFGLLATGVYLWYGGRLGPPTCLYSEVHSRITTDGYLEITVGASGTPTARSLRRHIELVARRYDSVDELRIQVVEGELNEVRRALNAEDNRYLLRHRMATYERYQTGELFIDTHRLEGTDRLPRPDVLAGT